MTAHNHQSANHHHGHGADNRRILLASLLLIVSFMSVEFAAGYYVGQLGTAGRCGSYGERCSISAAGFVSFDTQTAFFRPAERVVAGCGGMGDFAGSI